MTVDGALDLLRSALLAAGYLAGPLLVVALLVGLVTGILQTATQVNEASVIFLLKLLALAATVVWVGPHALQHMIDYTRASFGAISSVVR